MRPSPATTWLLATIMVTLVSLCSLIGVTIMPLISGPSYKTSITLFTGLAVGSLVGSAIFSLIPQAFALHTQADKAYLWKSLMIFFGIYLFYCSERIMRIYFAWKARNQSQQEQRFHLKKADKQIAGASENNEIRNGDEGVVPNSSATDKATHDKDTNDMTEISLTKEGGDEDPGRVDTNQTVVHGYHHHALNQQEVITKALKSGNNTHQSRLPKRSQIAPVAWMIIIGDGLHNFIDGLSIGAAFSESISLGTSTSLAVIFEEFPHELGDFAVLIASGMTMRQALGFNFLSACTCYLGMVFGILLGDMTQSASFIFALAGGMFLYISLVDMMGELSATLEECKDFAKESSHLLMMQNIGILSGIIIVFSLALYGNG